MFRQLKIRQQANNDYQQARGTAHKALLSVALKRIQQQQTDCRQNIHASQKKIGFLKNQWQPDLRQALTKYLVYERLQEIPNIGPQRKAIIIQSVFKGKLSDLYQANSVLGIGEKYQQNINRWVQYYEQRFEQLLQENFSGREKIDSSYRQAIEVEQQNITNQQSKINSLQKVCERIEQELNWLSSISAKEFYNVAKQPEKSISNINKYMQGVFAEWETIPDWFKEALIIAKIEDLPLPQYNKKSNDFMVIGSIVVIFVICYLCLITLGLMQPVTSVPTSPTRTATVVTLTPINTSTATTTLTPTPSSTPTLAPTPKPSSTPVRTAIPLPATFMAQIPQPNLFNPTKLSLTTLVTQYQPIISSHKIKGQN